MTSPRIAVQYISATYVCDSKVGKVPLQKKRIAQENSFMPVLKSYKPRKQHITTYRNILAVVWTELFIH